MEREPDMKFTGQGYESRAEECVRLANMTRDEMIQAELLKLRQTYLKIANSLNEAVLTRARQ